MVKLALIFGPRDYFTLMVLAVVNVSAAFGESALKGLTSLIGGLALALVRIDGLTGRARLSFGVPQLLDGIEVTTLAVARWQASPDPRLQTLPLLQASRYRC